MASIEEKVEEHYKKILDELGIRHYGKTESINRTIIDALRSADSKSGGSGNNYPDIQLLLENKTARRIPVMIEAKGLKNRLEKISKSGQIELDDIIRFAREDIGRLVMFSEDDNVMLPFGERFRGALSGTKYMVDRAKPDSYNFFILVFGCIQQAIDVLVSCIEYGCIPYIRYPVSLHYISLLSESMLDIEHIVKLRFKMSVAFVVYQLCDKGRLARVSLEEFLKQIQAYNFNEKLFRVLAEHDINENSFLGHTITQLVIDELEAFYNILAEESGI